MLHAAPPFEGRAAQTVAALRAGAFGGAEDWRGIAGCIDRLFAVTTGPAETDAVHIVAYGTDATDALRRAARTPWTVRSLTLIDPDIRMSLPELASGRAFDTARAVHQRFEAFRREGDAWNAAREIVDHMMGNGAWQRTSTAMQQRLAARTGRLADAYAAQVMTPLRRFDLALSVKNLVLDRSLSLDKQTIDVLVFGRDR